MTTDQMVVTRQNSCLCVYLRGENQLHLLYIFMYYQFIFHVLFVFRIQNTLQNSDWMPPVVIKLQSTKAPLYKIMYKSNRYNQKSVQRYCQLDPRCDIHGTKTMQAPPTKLFKLILPFLMRNAIFDTCRDFLPLVDDGVSLSTIQQFCLLIPTIFIIQY